MYFQLHAKLRKEARKIRVLNVHGKYLMISYAVYYLS